MLKKLDTKAVLKELQTIANPTQKHSKQKSTATQSYPHTQKDVGVLPNFRLIKPLSRSKHKDIKQPQSHVFLLVFAFLYISPKVLFEA